MAAWHSVTALPCTHLQLAHGCLAQCGVLLDEATGLQAGLE
jgi:hypothetical protein